MKSQHGEAGNHDVEIEQQRADDARYDQKANDDLIPGNVPGALADFLGIASRTALSRLAACLHQEQADDNGYETDRVQGKCPGNANDSDQDPTDARADNTGDVEHRAVEGNSIDDGRPVVHLFTHKRLSGRPVDSTDYACDSGNDQHLPVLRMTPKRHDSQSSGGQRIHDLRKQQDRALWKTIDDGSNEHREDQRREKLDAGQHPELEGRVCQFENQPGLPCVLEPRTDKRYTLASKPEPVVFGLKSR